MKRTVLMAAILIISSTLVNSWADDMTNEKEVQTKSVKEGGTVFLMYLGDDHTIVLQDLEVVDLKGVKFWKGRHIDMTWMKNKPIYVALDNVKQIVEYDSVEQYQQSILEFQKSKMQ